MRNLFFILTFTLTLVSCSEGYEKIDGKWTYVSYDEAVGKRVNYLNADNETFKVLTNKEFAIDKDNVYLVGGIIKNADPKSFYIIGNSYSADKDNVFLDYETVINADPKTFKILDFPYSKDDKKIYCGTLPLSTSDIENFVVTESSSMKTNELTTNFIKFNPEYNWIDTIKYNGVVYGMGKGKTKNETFEGYRKK
jgi:hypothetical protein